MISYTRHSLLDRGKVRLPDLLLLCFAVWPLFWNLWVSFNITIGIRASFPREFLIALSIISILTARKICKSYMLVWLVFFIAIIPSVFRGNISSTVTDIPVLISAVLICLAFQKMQIETDFLIRYVYIIGLFVVVTVIIDRVTGLFHSELYSLYTPSAQRVLYKRLTRVSTGGIIPHSAGAGCFICSGLGAFITLWKKRQNTALFWMIMTMFVTAFLMLQKRGFALDIILAVFVIWVLGWQYDKDHRINLRRQIRTVIIILFLVSFTVLIYYTVPFFRDAVDSLYNRFASDDETLSGRTSLYLLAIRFFQSQPYIGIGWGNYRTYTQGVFSLTSQSTYETHNVYLQLLCETGIIGLLAFLIAVFTTLIHGIRKYRTMVVTGIRDEKFYAIKFGLYLQLFFLFYCLSGNPLYDYNFLITYFFGVLLTF